jgi:hypothetical protein
MTAYSPNLCSLADLVVQRSKTPDDRSGYVGSNNPTEVRIDGRIY